MKTKYILAIFLILPIIVYVGWIGTLEKQIHTAKTVMVTMQGYDPVDFLSGHYLSLRPDWENTDCKQFENEVCPTELFARSYRYYLPEFDAIAIDERIRDISLKIEIEFAINKKANPLVKHLYINGQKWRDWFTQFSKQPQNLLKKNP